MRVVGLSRFFHAKELRPSCENGLCWISVLQEQSQVVGSSGSMAVSKSDVAGAGMEAFDYCASDKQHHCSGKQDIYLTKGHATCYDFSVQ